MTITFENDNDAIVYAFEKIISFARNNQYVFVAQGVWWLSTIIGLQQELVVHIDNVQKWSRIEVSKPVPVLVDTEKVAIHLDRLDPDQNNTESINNSEADQSGTLEEDIQDNILENCEMFLWQSELDRKKIARRLLQVSKGLVKAKKCQWNSSKNHLTRTKGIDISELQWRKAAGVCQRCAWPNDRKGSHKTLDCFQWKQLEKGTAPSPKRKHYN